MRKKKLVEVAEDWKPLVCLAPRPAGFGLITYGTAGSLIWMGFHAQPYYVSTHNKYTPEKLYFKCAKET